MFLSSVVDAIFNSTHSGRAEGKDDDDDDDDENDVDVDEDDECIVDEKVGKACLIYSFFSG